MEMCNTCGIVHDERDCPLCIAKDGIKDLETTINRLQEEITKMEASNE